MFCGFSGHVNFNLQVSLMGLENVYSVHLSGGTGRREHILLSEVSHQLAVVVRCKKT